MADWLSVIILGLIEGVTEFLPVSSTGHIQMAERWLTPQSELFDIVIQCGAVLAVLMVFQKRLQTMAVQWKSPATRSYVGKLMLAFLITTAGVLLMERMRWRVSKEDVTPAAWAMRVAWATLLGGVVILAVEWANRKRAGRMEITWIMAAAVGLAQVLAATYSGTSRSGASILVALMLGATRPAATEFSFLLGVPTLLAAGGYKLLKAWRLGEFANENFVYLALATAVATVMAFVAVKWLLRYVQQHSFVIFGWYRILLAAAIMLLLRAKPVV